MYRKILIISILSILIILFLQNNFITKNCVKVKKKNKREPILINILTRSGNREQCFKNLEKSIRNQTYKNIRHIISNDNINCKYLKNNKDVVNVTKLKKFNKTHCPYNLYINTIKKKVKKGWILILDDDSKLIDNTFIDRLVDEILKLKEYKAILFDSYVGNFLNTFKFKMPNIFQKTDFDINLIKYKIFDMSNFAFHHSIDLDFSEACGGDFIFFSKLLEKNLIKYVNIEPGIWANYEGKSDGNNLICELD